MASSTQQPTPADDLPRMHDVETAVDMPPSMESLSRFPWVNAVLQISTQEFGLNWARQTFGEDWQTSRPFLQAVVEKNAAFQDQGPVLGHLG